MACHNKSGWALSSHSGSNATWNGTGQDPWPHTTYATVAENACENCHKPHSAGGHARLLNEPYEEDNCIFCHNGNVAGTDIESELVKPYGHAVQNYNNIHEPLEDVTSGTVQDHVECTDCHNPHRSNATASTGAPVISGAINGVSGINYSGQAVPVATNQYEICFKCHADNNVLSVISIDRQLQQSPVDRVGDRCNHEGEDEDIKKRTENEISEQEYQNQAQQQEPLPTLLERLLLLHGIFPLGRLGSKHVMGRVCPLRTPASLCSGTDIMQEGSGTRGQGSGVSRPNPPPQ